MKGRGRDASALQRGTRFAWLDRAVATRSDALGCAPFAFCCVRRRSAAEHLCVCTLALGNASASSPDAADVLREACRKWRRDAQVESSTDRATPSTPPPKKRKRKIRHDEAISSFRLLAAHNVVRPSRSTFLSARHKKGRKRELTCRLLLIGLIVGRDAVGGARR